MASDLKDKAVNGMFWKAIDKIGAKAIQFIIGLLIARILTPEDFGIVGLLMFFIAVADTILDSGFANALIQKQNRTQTDYSTAFFFNIGIGALLYLIMWCTAPFIAQFYELPILCEVARIYSCCFVINSLTIVQTAKLSIELNFKLQSIISIVSVIISCAIGLTMAYTDFGVWALVWQSISMQATRMMLLWIFAHWRPSLIFSITSFKHLFSFGSKILCSGLINTIYGHLYSLVIGKAFKPSDVGHFNYANQFSDIPTTTLTSIVSTVSYPILARLQDDDEALRNAYLKLLRTPLFLLFPLLTIIIVLAEPIVIALIGEKWLPCVPLLQIIAFGAMWNPLTTINLSLLYVKGRTDKVLKLELIKKPIGFAILFASIPLGLFWLCAGKALYNFIAYCFNCHYTNKYLHLSFWQQTGSLLPIWGYCLLMAICVIAVNHFITLNIWPQLIISTIIAIVVYLLFAYIFNDSSLWEIINILKKKFFQKNNSSKC